MKTTHYPLSWHCATVVTLWFFGSHRHVHYGLRCVDQIRSVDVSVRITEHGWHSTVGKRGILPFVLVSNNRLETMFSSYRKGKANRLCNSKTASILQRKPACVAQYCIHVVNKMQTTLVSAIMQHTSVLERRRSFASNEFAMTGTKFKESFVPGGVPPRRRTWFRAKYDSQSWRPCVHPGKSTNRHVANNRPASLLHNTYE